MIEEEHSPLSFFERVAKVHEHMSNLNDKTFGKSLKFVSSFIFDE